MSSDRTTSALKKVVRIVWHPDDVHSDGTIKPSAFRRQDLHGFPNHVSVSDLDRLSMAVERAKIGAMKERQASREKASVVVFPVALLEAARLHDASNDPCLSVQPDCPEDPQNPGHCGIYNVSGRKTRSVVNELRQRILESLESVSEFEDFALTHGAADSGNQKT